MKAVIAAFNQVLIGASLWLWNFKCHEVSFPALQPSVQFAELVTQCCHYHDAVPCPAPSAAPPTVIGSVIDKMAQLENSNDAMCALLGWVWGVCSIYSIYSIYNISTVVRISTVRCRGEATSSSNITGMPRLGGRWWGPSFISILILWQR